MLYERWRQIAQDHRNELALHELASGDRWTFSQLAAAAEADPSAGDSPLVFAQGTGAGFIFSVLRAWRTGRVLCPLETGQPSPHFSASLPAGCVHFKTTSATTSAPRAVAFTAAQLTADAANIVATMGLRVDWPNLGVISLAHSYGFSNLVLPLLLHGIPLILAEAPLPEILRRADPLAPGLTLPGVPALWRAWFEAHAIPRNVKLAISAGSPLPVELEATIAAQRGLKVHNFYGSSECGGIAYDATATPRVNPACVGAPMRGIKVAVGVDGCLEVRSAAVGETYWPEPDERLGAGCFRTSDLAQVIDGQVHLLGRASDQINVAGRKVLPEVIERALLAHPDVRDTLVFGVPSDSPERGEDIVACVAGDFAIEDLKVFLAARLPAWQIPRVWRRVDSLEVNERGKRSRAEWRRKFLAGPEGNSNGVPINLQSASGT